MDPVTSEDYLEVYSDAFDEIESELIELEAGDTTPIELDANIREIMRRARSSITLLDYEAEDNGRVTSQ